MRFEFDNQSGTGLNPKRPELNAKKQALVVVALCDGDGEVIKNLAEKAISLVRESLRLSELNPSALKYCYVFGKKDADNREFVEFSLRVGEKTQVADGVDSTVETEVFDEAQGTCDLPCRVEFRERQNAIIAVAFCDGESLVSGYADAAQAQARGVLETGGVDNLSTMRCQYALTPTGDDSFVEFAVRQGVIIDD